MQTEVAAPKPRITYQQFQQQQHQQVQQHTVAGACRWRIAEAEKPGARKLGESLYYTLKRLAREPIGALALPFKPQDLVDHCRARISTGVVASTASQDVTALRSTIRDYVDSNELPHAWLNVFDQSLRRLHKEQLVAASKPRERLPTDEEIDLLLAYFEKQNAHPRTITDMVLVVKAELVTSRRISELCRIERQHVNVETKTCLVFDLKNSKGKGYHGEFALIEGAWELFERRLAEIPDEPTAKLFPFNPKTCSQRYTLAKKELQKARPDLFIGLRMHDNRAECATRLLLKGYSVLQVARGVTLHMDDRTLARRYARLKAADLHAGPVGGAFGTRA